MIFLYTLPVVKERVILTSSAEHPLTGEAQPEPTPHNQEKRNTIYSRRYRQTEKGKAAIRRYDQSPKAKERDQRYAQSERGKAAHNRYVQSEKGKKTASEGNKRRYEARKQ